MEQDPGVGVGGVVRMSGLVERSGGRVEDRTPDVRGGPSKDFVYRPGS